MGSCFTTEPDVDFDGPVDFDHFHILRAIGKGAFGKVCIVKKKDTKEMYAMKYMNKVQIIRKHAVENVFRESQILRKLEHNFLVNLWFTFQDQEDIFMVLDLMLGGDISYHLEKEGRFTVPRVRLYVAELSLALEYLKENKVIHRDVKPANMLLDSGGHVHLTDFNVACVVRSGVSITSVTGTKPYMAPEVLHSHSSAGYSYAVDWWGLGVSVYEMLRGQRPFSIDRHMTNEEIVSNIRHTRPSASVRWDHQTCDLLRMLLHPDEDKRLQSVEGMRRHRFFNDLDWEQVEMKEITPVYIPAQNRIHCDPTHELEEMIVEPNPLHKKHHRLSRRNFRVEDETLMEELDKLEKKFPAYNRMKLHVKAAERRRSAAPDGDVTQSSSNDNTDNAVQNLDQDPGVKTEGVAKSSESSDETSRTSKALTKQQQPQGEEVQVNRVEEELESAPDVTSSDSDGTKRNIEKQAEEEEESKPVVVCEVEEKEGEGQDKEEGGKNDGPSAAPEDVADAQEKKNSQTTAIDARNHDSSATSGNEQRQVKGQVSEEDHELSVGSPSYSSQDPPNSVERTDSMSSDALLLPREL